ncbi:hypothetical protein VTJ04DRAFT_10842 [Mycothermus thermophilus]|uniref:uncharacterized protein n=1 Tax=Humicola insolens TaxID=85995 RepID=UPI0037443750
MAASYFPESILILGVGELGTAILQAIAAHPLYDTNRTRLAVLRRPKTSTSPEFNSSTKSAESFRLSTPNGDITATLEAADLAHAPITELANIFQKYDVIVHAGGFTTPRGTLLRVAQAAVTAGVKRFFPWQFGADYEAIAAAGAAEGKGIEHSGHEELFGEMLAVRKLLREQERINWTIVSTGLFMSFLFLKAFGVVDLENKTLRALGDWEKQVTVTEAEGIGKMVAEVIFNPGETSRSGVAYIAGDTVSYKEIADIVEEVYGGSFTREVLDLGLLRKRIEESPSDVMPKYQHVFGSGVGVSWEKEKTVNSRRGIKLTNLREYVERNKEVLAASNQ